jgi:tetratricopeptide (TPR) repeat protein
MSAVDLQTPPSRHPWLDAVVKAPADELRALVGGYADVAPFGRAEPADAAVSLLFGVAEDDEARRAFDQGCLALLEELRHGILQADERRFRRQVAAFDRLLAVIRRTQPRETVGDLHTRYPYWLGLAETAVVDNALDLRREYWRVLALTQAVGGRHLAPRRLLSLWFDLCAESGPLGRYDESYLDVGLIGLRQLPLGAEHDSNEEAACHGIARWALRQRPGKKAFLDRWREIESAYPRSPTFWPPLVADVIADVEDELRHKTGRTDATFPAVAWWRDELDLPQPRRASAAPPSERQRTIEPPAREAHERILRDSAMPIGNLRPRIADLLRRHRRYADATGDVFYLVRTACNIGMRLIETNPAERAERGALAAELARQALDYEPADVFAWALWRDGLTARGTLAAAEMVGWEAVRQFPENPQWRSQLATLLADHAGRPAEAEALLRYTVGQFPHHASSRAQLAKLLIEAFGRVEEAVAVLRETMRLLPENPHTYTQLAILLDSRLHDAKGAIETLQALLGREPDNRIARNLLAKAQRGQRLGQVRTKARRQPPGLVEGESVIVPATARACRALFHAETDHGAARDRALAEIKRILAEDPGLAYARYVAERVGVKEPGGRLDTAFAFAFDRAARAGSAEAMRALLTQTGGIHAGIARLGVGLLSGDTAFELPGAANDADPGAVSHRLAALAGTISSALVRPGTERRPFIRLLSDFAAAELSANLAA